VNEENVVPPTAPVSVPSSTPLTSPVAAPASAPYRAPPQEEPAPPPAPRTWPIMGSALWVFGVSTWAFLVMGELTTSYGPGKRDLLVGEGLAAAFVVCAGIGAWVVALRATAVSSPPRGIGRGVGRAMAIAALAFVMWFVVTIAATIAGEASRKNADGTITVALVMLAAAAAFGGRRAAGFARSGSQRASLAIGIGAAVLTLATLIEVIATD
jgi:hypothetical protein